MATGKKPGKLARAKKAAKSAKSALSRKRATRKERTAADTAKAEAQTSSVNVSSSDQIDLAFLRGLIEAVDQSGIDSVEIDRDGTRVRISKTPPPAPVSAAMPAVIHHATPAAVPSAAVAAPAEAAVAAPLAAEAPKSNLIEVKSPMVGTFYRSPAPEAPSYVEVGSQVTKGQTLCILEAMKLMNEMESEVDGTIREILVDNADPVEYGQVLYRIEPASR
ncbi:MAG: acetyl-CoA carboxylase biotin carboxyl carrier protein [Longimicrobiales bacterium]